MSTIIELHNGHTKVARGRFGGESSYSRSQERRIDGAWKRAYLTRLQDHEDRTELSDCLHFLEVDGTYDRHPHDLELPDLPLVRERLEEGDRRNGLTTVLHGALGVAQWGGNRIEMPMDIGRRSRNRRGKGRNLKSVTLMLDEDGRIISAHCR